MGPGPHTLCLRHRYQAWGQGQVRGDPSPAGGTAEAVQSIQRCWAPPEEARPLRGEGGDGEGP